MDPLSEGLRGGEDERRTSRPLGQDFAQVGVIEAQGRLEGRQAWANEEFKRLELNLQEEGDIPLIDEMDTVNSNLEFFLQEAQGVMKKSEMEAIQSEVEAEVFLQTRTISLGDLAFVGSAAEGGDQQL